MEIKKCKGCLEEKEVLEFSKNNSKKDKLDIYCKVCNRLKAKKVRGQEREVPAFKTCNTCGENKLNVVFNIQASSVDGLSYTCKTCLSIQRKLYCAENVEKISLDNKKKRERKKESDIDSLRVYDKRQREKHREYYKEYSKTYSSRRRKESILYKLTGNVRNLVKDTFKRASNKKQSRTVDILGCSIEQFKKHLESQFLPWMTWENYGNCEYNTYNCSWQLDHIIPIALAKNEEELYLLNHWSNFQPLCGLKNQEKSNSMGDVYNTVLKIKLFENKLSFPCK